MGEGVKRSLSSSDPSQFNGTQHIHNGTDTAHEGEDFSTMRCVGAGFYLADVLHYEMRRRCRELIPCIKIIPVVL